MSAEAVRLVIGFTILGICAIAAAWWFMEHYWDIMG